MPIPDKAAMLAELDAVIAEAKCSLQPDAAAGERTIAMAGAAIERLAPPGSAYMRRVREVQQAGGRIGLIAQQVYGVLQGLRDDVARDRLKSVVELVHAEAFGDFLDMADHLLEQGFKDPAAVLAGSTLEAHLRALCKRYVLAIDDANGKPLKADRLNADLDKAGAYTSKGDQKSVTAWLDLRNQAAHGHYASYLDAQVRLLIASLRDFMTRYPA